MVLGQGRVEVVRDQNPLAAGGVIGRQTFDQFGILDVRRHVVHTDRAQKGDRRRLLLERPIGHQRPAIELLAMLAQCACRIAGKSVLRRIVIGGVHAWQDPVRRTLKHIEL